MQDTRQTFFRLFLSFILAYVALCANGQFNQKGLVKEYNRRSQKTVYSAPVEIQTKGAGSTVSGSDGRFTLNFNTAHVGDTISSFSIHPANDDYTLFNTQKISDWILTSNREMEVMVCKKSIIDDIEQRYTQNYINSLTTRYNKQVNSLKKQLEQERTDREAITAELEKVKQQYTIDSLEILANAIVFSHVDESELDSLEICWRESILRGDNEEAVRIGNEMDLNAVTKNRLDNLEKSLNQTREFLDKTRQTANVLEQHISNLENKARDGNISFPTRNYGITNREYYESLAALYRKPFNLYSNTIRCSSQSLDDIRHKYAHSLYKYAYACQREYSTTVLLQNYITGYTASGIEILKESADLGNYEALVALSCMDSLDYDTRYYYIKRARKLYDNKDTQSYDWKMIDFLEVVDGDSLYFHILDADSEIQKYGPNAVVLCTTILANSMKGKYIVPSSVLHNGIRYNIKVLGYGSVSNHYMNYYNIELGFPYILPKSINKPSRDYKVNIKEIIISNGIQELGSCSLPDSIKKLTLPASVNAINHSAIPSHKGVDIVLKRKSNYIIEDGILYSKDKQSIIAFLSSDIKTIKVNEEMRFSDDNFQSLGRSSFPDSLKRFVVSEKNPYYKTLCGILIDKDKDSILLIPKSIDWIPIHKSMISYKYNYEPDRLFSKQPNKHITGVPYFPLKDYTFNIDSLSVSIDVNHIFNLLLSVYIQEHKFHNVRIINKGHIDVIEDYLPHVLSQVSKVNLVFWGRKLVREDCLRCQRMGLQVLEYLHNNFQKPYQNDEDGVPPLFNLLQQRDSLGFTHYRDYNLQVKMNLEKALLFDQEENYEEQLARICYNLGEFDKSIFYADEAVKKDSTNKYPLVIKGFSLFEKTYFSQAINSISCYINSGGNAYADRAFLEHLLGMTEKAKQDYTMAINLSYSNYFAYRGRGDANMLLGDSIAAHKDYVEASKEIGITTTSQNKYYATLMLGAKTEATDIINKSINTYPNEPRFYYDAACLYARMHEQQKSLEYLKLALEKGFRRFQYIKLDDDLIDVRKLPEYQEIMKQYNL